MAVPMIFNAPSATPKKQQASKMVAQTLVRPAPLPLPQPCPACVNPSSSPYQSALGHDISTQVTFDC